MSGLNLQQVLAIKKDVISKHVYFEVTSLMQAVCQITLTDYPDQREELYYIIPEYIAENSESSEPYHWYAVSDSFSLQYHSFGEEVLFFEGMNIVAFQNQLEEDLLFERCALALWKDQIDIIGDVNHQITKLRHHLENIFSILRDCDSVTVDFFNGYLNQWRMLFLEKHRTSSNYKGVLHTKQRVFNKQDFTTHFGIFSIRNGDIQPGESLFFIYDAASTLFRCVDQETYLSLRWINDIRIAYEAQILGSFFEDNVVVITKIAEDKWFYDKVELSKDSSGSAVVSLSQLHHEIANLTDDTVWEIIYTLPKETKSNI